MKTFSHKDWGYKSLFIGQIIHASEHNSGAGEPYLIKEIAKCDSISICNCRSDGIGLMLVSQTHGGKPTRHCIYNNHGQSYWVEVEDSVK